MTTTLRNNVESVRNGGQRERVAIVGTGIAGMTAAWLLHERYDLSIFESNDYFGGHTHTVDVEQDGKSYAVDTGFIVYNLRTYPRFIGLLNALGVATRPTDMSFSVSDERSGLEYGSASVNALFAQRRNLASPRYLHLLREIVRFNQEARRFLASDDETTTLSGMLEALHFSPRFAHCYLTPMLASIWSADPRTVGEFPARHFLRFFENHGLLDITGRPQWRVVAGGSREYARQLVVPVFDRIRLSSHVERIVRRDDAVQVIVNGEAHDFDRVIVAAHSNEALQLLEDPTASERAVLGAIPYQENDVVLHTDARLLPRARRAWASWNYRIPAGEQSLATLTYNMNILQGLTSRKPFLVTLNESAQIAPAEVLGRWRYWHPCYSHDTVRAQQRHAEISGADRIYYCGAYWGYGFHEDGVNSAVVVARQLGVESPV